MSKLQCALLDDYQKVGPSIADWSSVSDRVNVFSVDCHYDNEDELVDAIGDCEIVVAMRERTQLSAAVLARLPSLKLLITSGMRNRAIDLEAAAQHGITVCGTSSSSTPPAELTWALILALARWIPTESAAMVGNGPWQSTVGTDLHGKTLGVLGLGRIGTRVARVGAAFDMRILAWSQNLTADTAEAAGVTLANSKDQLLEQSDFLTLHVVLSDRTRHLIGEEDLGLMKRSAYLVNSARAAIVDQTALISALQDQRIAGAGLDVFEIEPLPHDHPFRTLPNVVATPHLGYVSEANYRTYYGEALADVTAWLAGSPIRLLQ